MPTDFIPRVNAAMTAEEAKDPEEAADDGGQGDHRTPVTVLTGALGAGKTTLLRHVLERPHGYRVAVIQNEFSEEMGIEAPLIRNEKGESFKDIYELPNGCLCCSAKDGLVSALDGLLEQHQRFDYVLVEATGTADPESICEIFWVDEGLGSRVYLDGVVTLVDGRNALSALGEAGPDAGDAGGLGLEAETAKQVACADVILLNKADLAPAAGLALIASRVRGMNPTASVLESVRAAVPLESILGIRAFSRARLVASLASLVPPPPARHPVGRCSCDACPGSGAEHELLCGSCGEEEEEEEEQTGVIVADHGVESLFLRGGSPQALYDPTKVRAWIAEVLWEDAAGMIFRCKGLFQGPADDDCLDTEAECTGPETEGSELDSTQSAYALQGVGKLFEIEEAPRVAVAQSKFLFIGRGLQRHVLENGLRGCLLAS